MELLIITAVLWIIIHTGIKALCRVGNRLLDRLARRRQCKNGCFPGEFILLRRELIGSETRHLAGQTVTATFVDDRTRCVRCGHVHRQTGTIITTN